ncbi:MAG: hypothetical protein LQ346_008651 [Caloplaca aetnensis]|nr:MAG: hypothetical protein LQ346_008651 [Caloplaca aetnensis]
MSGLPNELKLNILSRLTAPDFTALPTAIKSWAFAATAIKARNHSTLTQVLANTELTFSSPLPQNQSHAICYSCHRVLRRQKFADSELGLSRGDTSKALGGPSANRRFCLACGLKHGIYEPGTKVKWNRVNKFACRTCGTFCGMYDGSDCEPEIFPLHLRDWMSAEKKRELRGYKNWASKQGVIVRARRSGTGGNTGAGKTLLEQLGARMKGRR